MTAYHLSFENTENAFAYKSDKELKQARFLFSTMSYKSLVKLGTLLTPILIKFGFPVKGLIRKTIFGQFVGGESLEEHRRPFGWHCVVERRTSALATVGEQRELRDREQLPARLDDVVPR